MRVGFVSEGGIDQVVDHVLFEEPLRLDALEALTNAFWVGVMCDIDELFVENAAR